MRHATPGVPAPSITWPKGHARELWHNEGIRSHYYAVIITNRQGEARFNWCPSIPVYQVKQILVLGLS